MLFILHRFRKYFILEGAFSNKSCVARDACPFKKKSLRLRTWEGLQKYHSMFLENLYKVMKLV